MLITVWRTNKTNDGVFGNLAVDTGSFKCVTMENGETLVPSGVVYDMLFMWSEHFQQIMPHILVPERTAIEVHWANYPNQLEGCLGLGTQSDWRSNSISESKLAWIGFIKAITDQPAIKIRYVDDYGSWQQP